MLRCFPASGQANSGFEHSRFGITTKVSATTHTEYVKRRFVCNTKATQPLITNAHSAVCAMRTLRERKERKATAALSCFVNLRRNADRCLN